MGTPFVPCLMWSPPFKELQKGTIFLKNALYLKKGKKRHQNAPRLGGSHLSFVLEGLLPEGAVHPAVKGRTRRDTPPPEVQVRV